MGGKSSAAPAPPAPSYGAPGQYIPGSFNPSTGMPFENPDYQAPAPIAMPDFGAIQQDQAAQQKAYQEQLAAQQAKQERIQGQNDRDNLYGDYMSAAESATDYINNQIKQQASNAALLGTKYEVNDDMKGTMINDYFASIWGAGDQSRLEALMSKWGKPKGFSGYSITRGDGSAYEGEGEASEESVAVSGAKPPTLAAPQEEEDTLAKTSILGG